MSTTTGCALYPKANRVRVARRLVWTSQADVHLSRLQADGSSLRAIAAAFNLGRTVIRARMIHLGLVPCTKAPAQQHKRVPPAKDEREPLPAGHPVSWNLINQGTCLQGAHYDHPDPARLRRGKRGSSVHVSSFEALPQAVG